MTKLALSKVVPGVSYATGQVVEVSTSSDPTVTVVPVDAVDKAVIIVAVCTQTLTTGYDAPLFEVGTDDDDNAFIDSAVLAGATQGDTFIGAGLLEAGRSLDVSINSGDVSGAFRLTVLTSPTS